MRILLQPNQTIYSTAPVVGGKRKWQLEKQLVISRPKTQQGITGSVAIWYKTDNIQGKKNRQEKSDK